jgi:hypothetical protein
MPVIQTEHAAIYIPGNRFQQHLGHKKSRLV